MANPHEAKSSEWINVLCCVSCCRVMLSFPSHPLTSICRSLCLYLATGNTHAETSNNVPQKSCLKKSPKLHKSMEISTWICRSKMATILDLASTTASLALAMARSWSLDQLESCFDRSKPLVWSKWCIDDHGSSWSALVYCVIDSLNFDQVVRLSMSQVLCTELPRFFSFRLNQTIKKWSRPRLTNMWCCRKTIQDASLSPVMHLVYIFVYATAMSSYASKCV